MQPREKYTAINILLIITVIILSLLLLRVWMEPVEIPVIAKVAKERVAVEHGTPLRPPSYYNVIVAKDLFNPFRQGAAAQSQLSAKPLPTMQPGDLTLVGTILLADKKLAIIDIKSSKQEPRSYSVGDTIGGFVIKDITEDKVVLYGSAGMQALQIRGDNFSGGESQAPNTGGVRTVLQRQRRVSPKKLKSRPPQRQRQQTQRR